MKKKFYNKYNFNNKTCCTSLLLKLYKKNILLYFIINNAS